jgi:hypothetical protein
MLPQLRIILLKESPHSYPELKMEKSREPLNLRLKLKMRNAM